MPKKGWECSRSLTGALLSLSLAASFHRTFRSTVSLQTAALSASGWSYPACQKLGEVGEQTHRLQDCCWCYLWKPGCKAKAALCCCCGARTSLREAQCLKRRGQLLCGFLQAHTSGFLSGDCPSLLASTSLILFLSPPPPSHQVYFKTPSGELQTVLLQEAPAVTVAPSSTSCSSPVSRNSGTASSSKKPTARKERPLPKIAPAGGVISLSAAQLAAAAQAMQTININGVQVQGVPVTITNAGGGLRAAPRRAGGMGGDRRPLPAVLFTAGMWQLCKQALYPEAERCWVLDVNSSSSSLRGRRLCVFRRGALWLLCWLAVRDSS